MLGFAERWLQEWQDLRDDLRHPREALQGGSGCSVQLPPAIFCYRKCYRFRHRYPQLELKLETGDAALAVDKVLQEETDIAIAARPDVLPARLQYCLLQRVPLVSPRNSTNVSQWLKDGEPDWSQVPLIVSQQGWRENAVTSGSVIKASARNIYAEVAGNEAIGQHGDAGLWYWFGTGSGD